MSTVASQSPAQSALADARFDMAAAAARTERQNRPAHLKVIAWALVIVAGGALALSTARWFSASAELKKQEQTAERMLRNAALLKQQIDAAATSGPRKAVQSTSQVRTTMQSAAAKVGLVTPALPTSTSDSRPGAQRTKWTYTNVKADSPEMILRWCDQCTKDVPWLEAYSITIKPEATQWSATVVFQRWERVNSPP